MPYRKDPIVTNEIYHVFNRGIDRRPIFTDKREFQRGMQTINHYRFANPPVKLSRLLSLPFNKQIEIVNGMQDSPKLVSIISFCLMPNHFHFLLQQIAENGISRFISQLQNAHTRYFNTRHDRVGPLLLDQFKTVRIETDEQLLHVCRYIHLNPYTGYVIKTFDDLITYSWSSFPSYISVEKNNMCESEKILDFFKNKEAYKQFVFDQADYQRKLDEIKHLTLENN